MIIIKCSIYIFVHFHKIDTSIIDNLCTYFYLLNDNYDNIGKAFTDKVLTQ